MNTGSSTRRRAAVNAIRAVIKDRRLELQAPPDWPDGTQVRIEPIQPVAGKIGIDESEWRDDPASLADWELWIKTFEPLEFTPEEAVRMAEFDEKMRRFNVEAVRRQMQEGADE
jgi:hypothetical protein